jgi:hypothetical protein
MEACREENEVEKDSDVCIYFFYKKICGVLFDAKTKLQNVDYVLGDTSMGVYVKSVICFMHVIGDWDSRGEWGV